MPNYLLADYLIPPLVRIDELYGTVGRHAGEDYYRNAGYKLPFNYTLTAWTDGRSIRVVFYDVGHGLFLDKARSQRQAYETANALQGLLQVLYGFGPAYEDAGFALHKIGHVPLPSWSDNDMVGELKSANPSFSDYDWNRLRSGVRLDGFHLCQLPKAVNLAAMDSNIREALVHFLYSRRLFYGYITGSYYHSHYRHDRRAMRKSELERVYYKFRGNFELAFVSAFKAIEALLGGVQIRERDIDRRFRVLPYARITATTKYRRFHEIFRKEPRRSNYRDMVAHFLAMRNATAAHSNKTPPERLMVSEDSLYEIQWFVSELILEAIASIIGGDLPKEDLPAVNPAA